MSCIYYTGDALKDRDVPIDHVYASPSLRCVETATYILEGWFEMGIREFKSLNFVSDPIQIYLIFIIL